MSDATATLHQEGPALDPAALARDVPGVVEFAGDSGSMRIERDVSPAARRWEVRRFISGGSSARSRVSAVRTQRFELASDGSVALAEQVDAVEDVEVVFDPPLIVLPAGLTPGQQRVQNLRMTVHPLGDRSRVRNRGPLVYRVTFVSAQNTPTPVGNRLGARISSTFTADLGPAQVVNESEQVFVPGLGLVFEDDRERTRVLGLPIRNNRERWTLERIVR